MLEHLRAMTSATDLPINADFLNGFADSPDGVAANVGLAVATGVAGLSIEDQIPGTQQLYNIGLAVERIAAARSAIDAVGGDALLVARSECYLTGHAEPLKEATRRLAAFAEAGADCLYAPYVARGEDIATLVKTVAPKPLNVLARGVDGLTVAALADLGVRRVSVGGALARTAWAGFQKAAKEIAEQGTFTAFNQAATGTALNELFARGAKR
jgi:2-methylisocitrate lyase-like PEP mutase family enzyme